MDARDTADDLTAQTFTKALARHQTFDPSRASLGPWILAIARNLVRDHPTSFGRSRSVTTPDGRTVVVSPELQTEEVYDRDRTAVWDPDVWEGKTSAMHWEEGGVSYALMGRSLTLDEAEAFFRAARPEDAAP